MGGWRKRIAVFYPRENKWPCVSPRTGGDLNFDPFSPPSNEKEKDLVSTHFEYHTFIRLLIWPFMPLLEMLFQVSHPNEFITFLWNEKCWVCNFLRRPVFVTIQSKLVVGTSSSTSFFFSIAVQRHFTPIRCLANCLQLMDCKISKTVFYKTFHTI